MRVLLLGSVLAFISSGVMVALADEPVCPKPSPTEPTATHKSVKVYPVGDLIALGTPAKPIMIPSRPIEGNNSYQAAPYQPAAYAAPVSYPGAASPTTSDQSPIGRLAEVVRAMSTAEVSPHLDTMSLVVRDTESGHREVKELLEGLRQAATPTIQVEFRRMFTEGFKTDQLTPEQLEQIKRLIYNSVLNQEEATTLRELDTHSHIAQPVSLLPGRAKNWGDITHRGQVMAIPSPDRKSIQLQLEYISKEGEYITSPYNSHTLHVPLTHSAIVHQEFKDQGTYWLITPSFIEEGDEEADTESDHLSKILYRERLFRIIGTVNGRQVGVPVDSKR